MVVQFSNLNPEHPGPLFKESQNRIIRKGDEMGKQRKRKARPVCDEHWMKIRNEAFSVIPAWTRPFAGFKINRMLREKGFVRSKEECAYCDVSSKASGTK